MLLLLHGTGGDESDLLSLGRELDADAAILSPLDKVSEDGSARFFRRFAEGVFDQKVERAAVAAITASARVKGGSNQSGLIPDTELRLALESSA